jgi:hypothetical protein
MNGETLLQKHKDNLQAKITEYEQRGFYIVERDDEGLSVTLERVGRGFRGFKQAALACVYFSALLIWDVWGLLRHKDKESIKVTLGVAREVLKKGRRRVNLHVLHDGRVHEPEEVLTE